MTADPDCNRVMTDVPEGWHDVQALSDFGKLLGPLKRCWAADHFKYGLLVQERHRNEAGVMHGGAMTGLIDEVIGTSINDALGRRHVTVQFATTFLKPVRVGDFVEPTCEIVEATRSMTFVEAKLTVAGELVATATLIFKAVRDPNQG